MQPSAQSADVRLVLADGRKVLADGRVVSEITIPQPAAQVSREILSGRAASSALTRIHRKLGDLPDLPNKMNPIAAVMAYTVAGLSDADIATALGAAEAQIGVLKDSDIYKQFAELCDRNAFDDAKRNARHIIAKASDRAADTMVQLLDSGDESIRAVAAREVMKTADVSLADSTIKRASGLSIKIVRKGDVSEDSINIEVK